MTYDLSVVDWVKFSHRGTPPHRQWLRSGSDNSISVIPVRWNWYLFSHLSMVKKLRILGHKPNKKYLLQEKLKAVPLL